MPDNLSSYCLLRATSNLSKGLQASGRDPVQELVRLRDPRDQWWKKLSVIGGRNPSSLRQGRKTFTTTIGILQIFDFDAADTAAPQGDSVQRSCQAERSSYSTGHTFLVVMLHMSIVSLDQG